APTQGKLAAATWSRNAWVRAPSRGSSGLRYAVSMRRTLQPRTRSFRERGDAFAQRASNRFERDEPPRRAVERVVEREPLRQQLQRPRGIIGRLVAQPGIQAIVQDRCAEGGHVNAELVLAASDRLQEVAPCAWTALQHGDPRLAVRRAIGLAHAE